MYDIPILFIFFNRLEVAQKTFERIREVRPSRLYLAQDGFRKEKGEPEAIKILHIRQTILSMIDWDCEVKTLFRESNVGCGMGVKSLVVKAPSNKVSAYKKLFKRKGNAKVVVKK